MVEVIVSGAAAIGTGQIVAVLATSVIAAAGAALQHYKDHLGNSHATQLDLVNDTNGPLIIEVSEVDNHDWDGDSRPDHTFNDVEIPPRDHVEKRQEINAKSKTAMSTMSFKQDGEFAFAIRVDQWAAMAPEESTEDMDLGNGWKAHVTSGKGGKTLQYRFSKE